MGGRLQDDYDEDWEQTYQRQRSEAQSRITAQAQQESKLQNGDIPKPSLQRPPTSISTMDLSDAGTLTIATPSRGFGSDSLYSALFSAAWFAIIVPATLATGAPLLFLPFWAAGAVVVKNAAYDPYVSSKISIGQFAWSLEKLYTTKTIQTTEGSTEDLTGAFADVAVIVNDVPQHVIKLYAGKQGILEFGMGLSRDELDYLAAQINEHLQKLRLANQDDEEI